MDLIFQPSFSVKKNERLADFGIFWWLQMRHFRWSMDPRDLWIFIVEPGLSWRRTSHQSGTWVRPPSVIRHPFGNPVHMRCVDLPVWGLFGILKFGIWLGFFNWWLICICICTVTFWVYYLKIGSGQSKGGILMHLVAFCNIGEPGRTQFSIVINGGYCTNYPLEKWWPQNGTLNIVTINIFFLRWEQKWVELMYADTFFTLQNRTEWQKNCSLIPTPSDQLCWLLKRRVKENG